MNWTIPGTVLLSDRASVERIEDQFRAMFLGGGIVLSQIVEITGLEPYTVQNWVKRGFLVPPDRKRYNLTQLCRIININMLKKVLPMEQIVGLLTYINGKLGDTSDDLVDDSQLYFMFVRLAARARNINDEASWNEALDQIAEEYQEPVPGAKEKLITVLRIMLTAWAAAQLHDAAERMVAQL